MTNASLHHSANAQGAASSAKTSAAPCHPARCNAHEVIPS